MVLVAQKGSDSIGWIDTESNLLVDDGCGDEPSNIVIDGQAERAYVALATESAVAVVDIAERRVVDRWTAVPDPMAMALSADGELVYVATQRSGQVSRYPFVEEHSFEAERDLISLVNDRRQC